MPHPDAVAHTGAHVVTEFLAGIVLITAGLLIGWLFARRRRLWQTSGVVIGAPGDAVASLRHHLFVTAAAFGLAGIALAAAPLLRPADARAGVSDGVALLLGIVFAGAALVLAGIALFGPSRLDPARVQLLRTAFSVATVPLVGIAFLAAVVTLAVPGVPLAGH